MQVLLNPSVLWASEWRVTTLKLAEQLLALGLQEAAAAAAPPPPPQPAVALLRTALQLQSCAVTCVRSAALLLALPASVAQLYLTYNVDWGSGLCHDSSSITAALVQLSQLRSLELDEGTIGSACLAAVGQLAHLTALSISSVHIPADGVAAGRCDLHLLPQQLQTLEVTVSSDGGPAAVSLGHITALKDFRLTLQCSAAPGSSLSCSLTALTV
jgi:hypothetical protein